MQTGSSLVVFGRFALLYGTLFAAFGAASPFLPAFLLSRGLHPNQIALVLGLGSAIRLLSGPWGGRVADRTGAARTVLAVLLAASAGVAVLYGPAHGLLLLAAVSLAHAAVLAPLTPLADALSLAASSAARFQYGWLRGAGSAAFIVGSALSGALVERLGIGIVITLNAGLLAAAAAACWAVPQFLPPEPAPPGSVRTGPAGHPPSWRTLLALPGFAPLMGIAALVGASHALHDSFGVIRWQASGMSARVAGLLWAESVAAEVLVFFLLGPFLIRRLGPSGAAALAAGAGILRWSVTATTAAVPAMALVEPLHGFTFALLHLVVMTVIAATVPVRLAATAQAFYGTVALGAGGTAATFACGPLFVALGAGAFWVMAALCALALPLVPILRRAAPAPAPAPAPA